MLNQIMFKTEIVKLISSETHRKVHELLLLDAIKISASELSTEMRNYLSEYIHVPGFSDYVILLIFKKPSKYFEELLITARSYNVPKYEYFKNKVGEIFKVV
jgi:hypothetical protein